MEASGSLGPLLQDQDLSSVRPFLEDEMRIAIESLETSTAAIEHQTESLTSQYKHLSSQLQDEKAIDQAEEKVLDQLRRRHTFGKQQTDVAVW